MKRYITVLMISFAVVFAISALLVNYTFMEWAFTGIVMFALSLFVFASGGTSLMAEAEVMKTSWGHYSPKLEKVGHFMNPIVVASGINLIVCFIIFYL
ncbi:hypothetical protein [Jeotgalibacillus sp. R-1-5s-1]|uniref:hypothetical protein n=1 Tax=Jeotgalibacillus sp. R-1-5s-1 TaxID=2555897 RepID=UPI00106A3351|nr:hypothetical protein [Jeotgalibacillus sp. R-1-5s-1]TFE00054.1 hypothetical protein E2491_06320 [Jeotgalibacillus sp. R-1-5s-1]